MGLYGTFKARHSLAQRIFKFSDSVDRICVIIEKARNRNSKGLPTMETCWYTVPKDVSYSEFMYHMRQNLNDGIGPEKGIFFLVNEEMVPGFWSMQKVWDEYKDEDGAVYVVYGAESTFG